MEITPFKEEELDTVLALFNNTLYTTNIGNYDFTQLDILANKEWSRSDWLQKFTITSTYVIQLNGILVGFGNLSESGNIEFLYIHKDYQKQGLGTHLLQRLEEVAIEKNIAKILIETTTTAKDFFEKKGYRTITPQQKRFGEIMILQYFMRKSL